MTLGDARDEGIHHVVVLMLENRSFDHLLGLLDHPVASFPRIAAGEEEFSNVDHVDGTRRMVVSSTSPHVTHDVPHSHAGVMTQLALDRSGAPTMGGFVDAYRQKVENIEPATIKVRVDRILSIAGAVAAWCITKHAAWTIAAAVVGFGAGAASLRLRPKRAVQTGACPTAAEVMHCLDPASLTVLPTLAKEFAVCTNWFAPVPGATWPNRQFVHTGTSHGTVDIEPDLYDDLTIQDMVGEDWWVAVDGMAPVMAHLPLLKRVENWYSHRQMWEMIEAGRLPKYLFIEPRHTGNHSNSLHPGNNTIDKARKRVNSGLPTDFQAGEQLVGTLYERLRSQGLLDTTLLVITFDEHGGWYDHVQAQKATPPGDHPVTSKLRRLLHVFVEWPAKTFGFDVTGARVPAIVISSRIAAGTVDDEVKDHTCIPATVADLFAPMARTALHRRVHQAPSLTSLLSARSTPMPEFPQMRANSADIRGPELEDPPIGHPLYTLMQKLTKKFAGEVRPGLDEVDAATQTARVLSHLGVD